MRRLVSVALGWLVAFAAVAAASRAAAAAVPPGRVAPDTARDSLKAFRAQNESPDSEPELVLVELQVGRAASRTVSAYRVGAEALLPVTTLLQLGEAGYRLSLDGRLEATVNPGGRRLLIDVHRDTMSLGTRRVEIEPAYRFFHDNELYVGARRLSELLESRILVDWGELSVTLVDDGKLPIGSLPSSTSVTDSSPQSTRMRDSSSSLSRRAPTYSSLSWKKRYAGSISTRRVPKLIVSRCTSISKRRPPGFTVASSRPSSDSRYPASPSWSNAVTGRSASAPTRYADTVRLAALPTWSSTKTGSGTESGDSFCARNALRESRAVSGAMRRGGTAAAAARLAAATAANATSHASATSTRRLMAGAPPASRAPPQPGAPLPGRGPHARSRARSVAGSDRARVRSPRARSAAPSRSTRRSERSTCS